MVGVLFGRWSVVGLPFGRWSVVIFGLVGDRWFYGRCGRWSVFCIFTGQWSVFIFEKVGGRCLNQYMVGGQWSVVGGWSVGGGFALRRLDSVPKLFYKKCNQKRVTCVVGPASA